MIGIYRITNKENGRFYIGSSSKSIINRWGSHISSLENGNHVNYRLQRDWNKHGCNSFVFEILEVVNDIEKLLDIEQKYIDDYKSSKLYNIAMYTTSKYIKISKEFLESFDYIKSIDSDTKKKLKDNIIIYNKKGKLKKIGKGYYDFSQKWFGDNHNTGVIYLKNAMYNFFKHHMKTKSNEIAWTTFKSHRDIVKDKGNIKGYLPISNILGEDTKVKNKRNILCFVGNCFPNTAAKLKYNRKLNDEEYALGIMVKWIIKASDINKPIHIYIPSNRMEYILRSWLANKEIKNIKKEFLEV